MRHPRVFLLALAPLAFAFASCNQSPPEPATPEPTPAPTPMMTPAPATAAMARAIQLYPDLGKKDSIFNQAFRERYDEIAKSRPSSLTTVDWPLDLARRTGDMLGVEPLAPATPTPAPTPATPTPAPATPIVIMRNPTPVSALDRGAYGGKNIRRPSMTTPIPKGL